MSANPAVDAVTPKAMVVLQDRPVVPFSEWLGDTLRACSATGRGLQIVTPVGSRITMPLRLVLAPPISRWVARDDSAGTYYDGLSGGLLEWDGTTFVAASDGRRPAPAYTARPPEPVGAQLTLTFRVRHQPDSVLGGAVEQLCSALTGAPPSGWGTAEPVSTAWQRDELTELYRRQAPRATWLAVVGGGERPAIGTMLLSPGQASIDEAVTLVVGYQRVDEPPVAELPTIIGELAAAHPLVSLFAQLSPGRTDLTTEPYWVGPPAPIGMAVSGSLGAASGPPEVTAQQIGDGAAPAVWYALGDGWSQDGWPRYEALLHHLRAGLAQ